MHGRGKDTLKVHVDARILKYSRLRPVHNRVVSIKKPEFTEAISISISRVLPPPMHEVS